MTLSELQTMPEAFTMTTSDIIRATDLKTYSGVTAAAKAVGLVKDVDYTYEKSNGVRLVRVFNKPALIKIFSRNTKRGYSVGVKRIAIKRLGRPTKIN